MTAAWAIERQIVAIGIRFDLDAIAIHDQEVGDNHYCCSPGPTHPDNLQR